jgi:hypothetical protein
MFLVLLITKTKMQKPLICIQDITTLFVLLDDHLKGKQDNVGRPAVLRDSEVLTMLLWCTLLLRQRHLKEIYGFISYYHKNEFPRMPAYKNFVLHAHRLIPTMFELLESGLAVSPVQFVDSTMLPVCRLDRANSHRVAKGAAAFGKNHQGWHYGFKLHATVNTRGQLCGFYFTEAGFYDAQALPHLIRGKVKVMVGDGTYGAGVMRGKIWKAHGVFVIAPAHPRQRKKVMAKWQHRLLRARTKIEAVFDYLKNHLGLVTSFPRSVSGYFLNYLRHLLAYQMIRGVS